VEFNGTAAQDIKTPSSASYNHLILSTSGTKEVQATLNIDGDLTITGTAALDVATNTSDLTVAGDWINGGGTFTEGTQTVTFDGTSQTITSAGQAFFNLTLDNSGTKTLGDALDVNGVLTINTSVTLDVSVSAFGINLAGNWTNDGTFTANSAEVIFDGSSTQSVSGTSATTFNNINVTNTAGSPGVQIQSDQNLIGILTLGANVTFDADGVLMS